VSVHMQNPTTINGINISDLRQAISEVADRAEAAQTHWKIMSQWKGGARTDHFVDGVDIGGRKVDRQFQLHIDEPCELCGTNQFANPQEYLLAATNACMMVGYATVAAVMGVRLTKLEVEVDGDIDLRGFLDVDRTIPPGYRSLHFTVRIGGDGTLNQFEKMHEVVRRTSPNYYNISHPVELTSDLIVESALSDGPARL
jgi:uncharacterized OsmC-like protein